MNILHEEKGLKLDQAAGLPAAQRRRARARHRRRAAVGEPAPLTGGPVELVAALQRAQNEILSVVGAYEAQGMAFHSAFWSVVADRIGTGMAGMIGEEGLGPDNGACPASVPEGDTQAAAAGSSLAEPGSGE